MCRAGGPRCIAGVRRRIYGAQRRIEEAQIALSKATDPTTRAEMQRKVELAEIDVKAAYESYSKTPSYEKEKRTEAEAIRRKLETGKFTQKERKNLEREMDRLNSLADDCAAERHLIRMAAQDTIEGENGEYPTSAKTVMAVYQARIAAAAGEANSMGWKGGIVGIENAGLQAFGGSPDDWDERADVLEAELEETKEKIRNVTNPDEKKQLINDRKRLTQRVNMLRGCAREIRKIEAGGPLPVTKEMCAVSYYNEPEGKKTKLERVEGVKKIGSDTVAPKTNAYSTRITISHNMGTMQATVTSAVVQSKDANGKNQYYVKTRTDGRHTQVGSSNSEAGGREKLDSYKESSVGRIRKTETVSGPFSSKKAASDAIRKHVKELNGGSEDKSKSAAALVTKASLPRTTQKTIRQESGVRKVKIQHASGETFKNR